MSNIDFSLILMSHRSVQCGGENCPLIDLSKANLNLPLLQYHPYFWIYSNWIYSKKFSQLTSSSTSLLFMNIFKYIENIQIYSLQSKSQFNSPSTSLPSLMNIFKYVDWSASDNWLQVGLFQCSLLPKARRKARALLFNWRWGSTSHKSHLKVGVVTILALS